MEIELKYKVPTEEVAEAIWENEMFADLEEPDSREELCLDARYYDTAGCDLAKNEIAYRIRKEGQRWVAALKWKGRSEEGLHTREEINVPVMGDIPDPMVFSESKIGRELLEILGGRGLRCFLETRFHRKRFRIDTGTGLFEFSIDQGKIITEYGELPISEAEIELFSGETEELRQLGDKLQKEFGLEPEDASKYARGINMILENKDRS
ncbi:MAG: CYTH domain-containing protein [Bacillota bacterium]|nr:CYTH domain-containing protein [Bacillota bacterium]